MSTDMTTCSPPPRKFQFIGGALCLDFCNSVGGKREAVAREHLRSYEDFHSWCEQAGLLRESSPVALVRKAKRQPAEAAEVFARAIALREAIYHICLAVAKKRHLPARDLSRLNDELRRSSHRLRLAARGGRFDWEWTIANNALDAPLGPIARSAAELLTTPESLAHVHQCQGENCGWLFIDSSKNHSRCWCDMRDCGNRAKVRRFRMRNEN